ncbi:MAG: hypothetical protein WBA97_12520 [Actinophytocola sp.]|uniref:hypothetical protein n=1 Tax=Actinophytocola sp. TaxID=1872138 RepID=UPI003C719C88
MRIPDTWQPPRPGIANTTADLCPRRYRRSMNPPLPPPDSLACLARGPDCCATSAAADARRVA